MYFAFINVLLSIIAGLIGTKYALQTDHENINTFIYCQYALLMICTICNIYNNKFKHFLKYKKSINRYALLTKGINFYLYISIIISVVLSLETEQIGYTLVTITALIQNTTYAHTNSELYIDIKVYWIRQVLSAISRLIAVLLFTKIYSFGFSGVLFSNLIAALVIAITYRVEVDRFFGKYQSVKFIKLDEIAKSMKQNFELNLIYIYMSVIGLRENTELIVSSTPYLTTILTSFRNFFSFYEKKVKPSYFFIIVLIVLSCSVLYYYEDNEFFDYIYNIIFPKELDIVKFIFEFTLFYSFLHYFTLGYLYIDYNKSITKALILATLTSLLFCCLLFLIEINSFVIAAFVALPILVMKYASKYNI